MNRRRLPLRPAERGFVTLAALFIILVITVIGTFLMSSLFSSVQGQFGYGHAVSAASLAEAGLHWAGNKLGGSSATTQVYQGDTGQTLQAAGGQRIGNFDVALACADGTAVNVGSAGCATSPNLRVIRATGYAPSKAAVLGRRIVQAVVSQETFFTKTICAYQRVALGQGVAIQGDVGSEGTAIPDVSVQGPPSSPATIQPAPGGAQPGSAYAVSTVNCSRGCESQIAGTINSAQAPGSVCPRIARVWSTYACTPGNGNLAGGTVQISAANNSLNNVSVESGGSLTFITTGPTDILTVNVNSISVGAGTQLVVQGGGIVQLNVKNQLTVGRGSAFGLTTKLNPLPHPIPPANLVPAGHLIVRSCNADPFSPAISFTQSGGLSAVFIAPYGIVKLDQAQDSRGAILAQTVLLDQDTVFGYEASASAVGFGFNKLLSWQDVP